MAKHEFGTWRPASDPPKTGRGMARVVIIAIHHPSGWSLGEGTYHNATRPDEGYWDDCERSPPGEFTGFTLTPHHDEDPVHTIHPDFWMPMPPAPASGPHGGHDLD